MCDVIQLTRGRDHVWLQHTATHCNTLQHTATHVTRHTWTHSYVGRVVSVSSRPTWSRPRVSWIRVTTHHMNESCHTYKCVTSHTWRSHVTNITQDEISILSKLNTSARRIGEVNKAVTVIVTRSENVFYYMWYRFAEYHMLWGGYG